MGGGLVIRNKLDTSVAADIVINWADTRQTMSGFGASNAFLPNALSDAEADLYFDVTSGIGLTYLRVGIDPSGGIIRGNTANYSDATKAAARGARVWAAPWSAPGVWKSNGSPTNGGHLLPANYSDWANRLATFVTNFPSNTSGVTLYALSAQNEPDFSASYETMLYTTTEMVNFVKVLGPILRALSPAPLLMMPEAAGWSNQNDYTNAIIADPTAANLVDLIASHQYGGVASPASLYRPNWETEMSSFEAFDASMSNALTVAGWIYDGIVTGQVSNWHYWWLYGHDPTNQGLSGSDNSVTPLTKRLYAMGQWSKFVRPGATRVGFTGSVSGLNITTFWHQGTGAVSIVVVNTNGSATQASFDLTGLRVPSMTPYVTSASLSLAAQSAIPAGSRVSYLFPASSVTTLTGTGS